MNHTLGRAFQCRQGALRGLATAMIAGALVLSGTQPVSATESSAAEVSAADEEPEVVGLTVEHLVEPIGVGTPTPRFSWQALSADRDQAQTAYELEVSPGVDGFEDDAAWQTGRVDDSAQVLISYDGDTLTSNTAYQWRVRIWDTDDRASAWSEPASFATGLLDPDDWQASWIAPATAEAGGSYLRGEVTLSAEPERAVLYVSGRGSYERGRDSHGICCEQDFGLARGMYEPFVNGDRVGDAELESQPVDSRKRTYYRAWDVTAELVAGENVVGLSIGEDSDLVAQLVVDNTDGSTTVLATDDGWTSLPSPTRRAARYNGETYDARLERDGWAAPGDAGTGWSPVRVMDTDLGAVDAAPNEPMRVVKTIEPVAVTEPVSGVYVLDFGQNISGRTRLTTTLPAGAVVTVKHGERVTNGRVDNGLIMAAQTSRVTGDGGPIDFAPSFTYAGFRWVEVTGLSAPPADGVLVAEEIHNDVAEAGTFAADDTLLNRLHVANVQTQVNGLHGIPEDTPTREKRGWTADAHIAAEATINNKDMAAFYTKWIADLRDATGSDGWVPDIVPTELGTGWATRSDPAWASATALMPYYVWKQYGDERVIAEHYDAMATWVDYVGTRTTDFLVTNSTGAWGNDWLSIETTDGKLFRSGFYYWGASIVAEIAAELGHDADAEAYATLAQNIADAINEAYFNGRSSYGSSQFANAFPLVLGIVPDGREQRVVDTLVQNVVEKRGNHFTGGLPGIKYIPEALEMYGRDDVVLDVVRQTDYPGWGYMLENGPGTIWEDWHAGASSLNHPMFTSIDNWLYTAVAGIRQAPGSVGLRELVFEPKVTADLPSASGSRDTPYGEASISWERVGSAVNASVSVPFGSTATVVLPGAKAAEVVESGGPVALADGVRSVEQTDAGVEVVVGSGDYHFASDARLGLLVRALDETQAAQAGLDGLELGSDREAIEADLADAEDAITTAVDAHLADPASTDKAIEALVTVRRLAARVATIGGAGPVREAAESAIDALSRYVGSRLEVTVGATTPETTIAPGESLPLTITAASAGTGVISELAETVEVPEGWEATRSRGFPGSTVGTGAQAQAEYVVTAPEEPTTASGRVTVTVQLTVDGVALTQVAKVDLAVKSAVQVADVTVAPAIVEPGGHAWLRADLGNRLGSAEAEAELSVTDLPAGWTAADAARVSVSPSGRRIVSQRLVAAEDAESGEAVALVQDRFGVTVSATPVALRVRGSSNCSSDSTGLACLPASARMVTSFETGTEGWTAGENTSAADAVTSFANGPGKASVGERALEMKPQGSPAGNAWRSVGATFDEPVETGGAIALAVDVNGYGGGGASNHARVTATAVGGEVAEATLPIAPDSWSTVRVPLAELEGAPISAVTVSFRGETAGGWPARFQIDAVRLDTSMPESENLARGRTVTASNPIGCCGWEVGKLTDGQRTSSSSAPGYSNATAYSTPDNVEWVRIDLGASAPIGRVLLYPRTSRAGEGPELTGRNFPVDFRIETSDNGTDWATVGTFAGQQAGNGLPRTYYVDEDAAGRYVRVYVTKLGPGAPDEQGEASGGHRLQLAEAEVYAPREVDTAILAQPRDVSVDAGEDARFSVSVTSDPYPSVTWERSVDGGPFEAVAQGTGETLLVPNVGADADGTAYRAVVDNGRTTPVVSEEATLSVAYRALSVATQPRDVWVRPDDATASFEAEVEGTGVRYQWQRSADGQAWRPVAGATGPALEATLGEGVRRQDHVRLVAWNGLGEYVVTEAARVNELIAPEITGLPSGVAAQLGETVRLVATVTGNPEPDLQWLTRAAGSSEWTEIEGETGPTLDWSATLALHGGRLGLRATSTAGEVTAEVAVTVTDPNAVKPAPQATRLPTVAGRPVVGARLTATPGVWDVAGVGHRFQWLRNGTPIAGATGSSYLLSAQDRGRRISVQVTASKAGHTDGRATSAATAAVARAGSKVVLRVGKKVVKRGQAVSVRIVVRSAVQPTGKVVVSLRGMKARTVTLRGGVAQVVLRPRVRGVHRLKVTYRGNATVEGSSRSIRVRVR